MEVIRDLAYAEESRRREHRLDVYRPKQADGPLPVVMYIHGGGFRILSKDTHWMMGLAFARRGYLVFNVGYRLAPTHPFPAAIEDSCRAFEWVVAHAARFGGDLERLVIAGESSGATPTTTRAGACAASATAAQRRGTCMRWGRAGASAGSRAGAGCSGTARWSSSSARTAATRRRSSSPMLVNLGGDLCCSGPRRGRRPWQVGVDTEGHGQACRMVFLSSGALATSGDANRFLLRDGVRYSHVLDARSGWPVAAAAHAVTVAAPSCIEAGSLATLALLNGAAAERFLAHERVPHWITR